MHSGATIIVLLGASLTGCVRGGFSHSGTTDGSPRDVHHDVAETDGPRDDLQTLSAPLLDPSFNGGNPVVLLRTSGGVQAKRVLIDSQQRIVIAGQSWDGEKLGIFATRLEPDGSFDPTFTGGTPGFGLDDGAGAEQLEALAITRDDRILLGGGFYKAPNHPAIVARLGDDGSLDATFGVGGITSLNRSALEEHVWGLVVEPSDEIAFVSTEGKLDGGQQELIFGRLSADGQLANTAPTDDIGVVIARGTLPRLTMVGGHAMIAARIYDDAAQFNALLLARLEGGALDATFGDGKTLQHVLPGGDQNFQNLVGESNGRLTVCNILYDATMPGATESGISRFLSDGMLDTSFGDQGLVRLIPSASSQPLVLLIDSRGRTLVIGINRSAPNQLRDVFVQRLLSDGSIDPSFLEDSATQSAYHLDVGGDEAARGAVLDEQGRLLITGWRGANGEEGGWIVRLLLPD
ncbi:MAG: hypothetical protein JRH20_28320 [Deltaproteobacteria bacterium]|nr:hypothetical protein [Deltaproteobacteria bacterium]